MMRLAVLKERRADEARVAAMPETVKKMIGLGLTVAVEAGAGLTAACRTPRMPRPERRSRRTRPRRWPAQGSC